MNSHPLTTNLFLNFMDEDLEERKFSKNAY